MKAPRASGEAAPDYPRLAQEWIAAWNAHDLDRILAHYAEEVELVSPFVAKLTGGREAAVYGQAALRQYFARGLAAYPALRFELIRLFPGARSCVVQYRSIDGLMAAEVMEFDDRGRIARVLAHYAGPDEVRPR